MARLSIHDASERASERLQTDKSEFSGMKVELRKWCLADKKELKELCNAVDRT